MALQTVGTIAANDLQPEEFRRILRAVGVEGTLKSGDFAVTQNGTPNASVNVASGEALVQGDESTNQGLYYVRNDATVNVSGLTSSGTNPRKAIIVLRVYDDDYSGAVNGAALEAILGTPASSPSEPATPNSAIKLATIDIPQSASSVVTANITSTRYRSAWTDEQFLVNDAPSSGNGIIGGPVTIVNATVTMPTGWTEYDCHLHGKVVYEAQGASGDQARFTTLTQAPSGTTRNEGRVSIIGHTSGVSVYETDPIDTVVQGLTGNLTFRYQATVTDGGGGNYVRRMVIASLRRTR